MKKAWEELSKEEYNPVWDRFDSWFQFSPSVSGTFPGILEPYPSMVYSIEDVYSEDVQFYESKTYARYNKDLQDKFLKTFKLLTPPDDWMYALDWQHPCYRFFPHIPFRRKPVSKEWPVPILPNGDYFIFLEKDFKYGVFGHPWQETMCIFGEEMLAALENNMPNLFTKIVRDNTNLDTYTKAKKTFTFLPKTKKDN